MADNVTSSVALVTNRRSQEIVWYVQYPRHSVRDDSKLTANTVFQIIRGPTALRREAVRLFALRQRHLPCSGKLGKTELQSGVVQKTRQRRSFRSMFNQPFELRQLLTRCRRWKCRRNCSRTSKSLSRRLGRCENGTIDRQLAECGSPRF